MKCVERSQTERKQTTMDVRMFALRHDTTWLLVLKQSMSYQIHTSPETSVYSPIEAKIQRLCFRPTVGMEGNTVR